MTFPKSHIKINLRSFFILTLIIFLFQESFAQQFFVKTYTIENGLSTRNINDACQDRDGIMWFATNYGISKYDGFSFTNYDAKSGLPNQKFRKIKSDQKGILWAMPDNTLDTIVYLKNNKWSRIAPPEKVANGNLMNSFDVIYKNGNPVICLGTYNGYYIYRNSEWTHFTISKTESLNYIYTVVAKNDKFYLSTKNGLCTVDNGTIDWTLNKLIKPNNQDIIAINFENKNTSAEKLWLLTENWLGYIEHNNFRMVTNKFQLPHPSIYYYSYVSSDKSGNVFFGNIWAKYYISKSSNVPVQLMFSNGFSSQGATSVFIDRGQNIWITDTRGINKIKNLNILNYFKKDGILEDEVTAITEMNNGEIVFGHNNGISILNNKAFTTIEFPDLKLNTRRVSDMMRDREGNVWFVSINKGLGKIQPSGNITWYSNVNAPITNVVHQDKKGRIWVGADKKLFYLNNNLLTEYEQYKNPNTTIRKIFSDNMDGIYIAGSTGLWHVHDNKTERIPSPQDKKADNVFAYYENKKGDQFVGTINGLYVIENGIIVKYKKNGIEINNPIFFIFQDKNQNYWIGSDNGVYKWDGASRIETYNIYNGLAGWETNRAAGMQDSKGRIWIGTDRGLTCFEPGFDKTLVPTPVIKLLYIEDSKGLQHALTKKCTINYADNTLLFQFRGISFYNEDLIEYKYKLEGFDKQWQHINQPLLGKVKYIGLKPGKYVFCVMAKNISGTWSEVSRSAPIRITPPIYLTWWFLLLAFMVIGGITYGLIRIKVQQLHNSELEKEIIERKRIEQALTESRQKFQDLVELLPETIYEADFSGRLVYLNDTGFRLFGFKPEDINTDTLIDQLVTPESKDDIRLHMEALFKYKKADRAIMTGISKSGKTFPFSIHSVPVLSENMRVGTRGVIFDLTEQKNFEDQMQKNAEDLQALNNSKDKFFSIIAHDLRSPFTTFLGFTEVLDEEIDTLPKDELKTIVTYLRNSAINLYQLLENLLEWSLLHREITSFEPESVLLLPLVKNCINTISDSAKLKDIEIRIEIPEHIQVEVDVHMLQTIVRNLLSNAVKFTPGGGSVHISAFVSEKHFVTVAVKDTGIGIKAEFVQKIFLFVANNKTKGTDGELSSGLGLILCKEFVEKHGGKIWVESEEGKGSTFYFTLGSNEA